MEAGQWAEYMTLNPSLGVRIDHGFARLCALLFNRFRNKNDPPTRAADWLPHYGPPKATANEVLAAQFAMFAAVHNKRLAEEQK